VPFLRLSLTLSFFPDVFITLTLVVLLLLGWIQHRRDVEKLIPANTNLKSLQQTPSSNPIS
jgi:hypothetical protein